MPVNSPSSQRSGSSSLSSNQTSRVQSTVPGSRADVTATGEMVTPIRASEQSSESKAAEVPAADLKEDSAVVSHEESLTQKIQLSDLQNILGNLGEC